MEERIQNIPSVDLHCHSNRSDGTETPAAVVRQAAERGLSALILTDYDTTAGVAEAAAEANRLGIDFLPGIELSCSFPRPGTMHLLGYGVDPAAPALRELIDEQSEAREERNRLIVRRLNALGLDVSWSEVQDAAAGAAIGRPHIAAVMVRNGLVLSSRQAFEQYLGGGGAAYVDTQRLEPERAFDVVRRSGGLVSLAHPLQLRRQTFEQLDALVRELAEQGLEAIETIHSGHVEETVHRLTRLADRHGLLATGGSDFHGSSKPGIKLGLAAGRPIPRSFYDAIVDRLRDRRPERSRRPRKSDQRPAPALRKAS